MHLLLIAISSVSVYHEMLFLNMFELSGTPQVSVPNHGQD